MAVTAASAPLTATQRAQAAYQEMLERQHQVAAARLKRDRARNIRMGLITAVVLGGGLAYGFIYGLPTSLYHVERMAKPVDPFVTTRVGLIRTPYKRDVCRQVEFNNKTGAVTSESYVPCDGVKPGPGGGASSTQARNRFNALRNAFSKR